jgi:hypothetical protein
LECSSGAGRERLTSLRRERAPITSNFARVLPSAARLGAEMASRRLLSRPPSWTGGARQYQLESRARALQVVSRHALRAPARQVGSVRRGERGGQTVVCCWTMASSPLAAPLQLDRQRGGRRADPSTGPAHRQIADPTRSAGHIAPDSSMLAALSALGKRALMRPSPFEARYHACAAIRSIPTRVLKESRSKLLAWRRGRPRYRLSQMAKQVRRADVESVPSDPAADDRRSRPGWWCRSCG